MKRCLINCLLVIICLFEFLNSSSQEFKNDAGEKEKLFISQVKQIDEFFERFNDDPDSYIREVYKTYNTKFNLDRKTLIKSLFNREGKTWTKPIIDSFVKKALLTEMPNAKNWNGNNWFAEVNCKFQYYNTVIDIPLILKISTDEYQRSKWIITGLKPNLLKEPEDMSRHIDVRTIKTKFINPANHATNFTELQKALDDKENLSDYFEKSFFFRRNSVQFYQAILNNKIKFLSIGEIKYHFLNVKDYVFIVEFFQRESSNSGWLISVLKNVTIKEKKEYEEKLLGD